MCSMAAVTTFNRSGGTVILMTDNMRLVAEYVLRAVVMAGVELCLCCLCLFERREILACCLTGCARWSCGWGQRLAPFGLKAGNPVMRRVRRRLATT